MNEIFPKLILVTSILWMVTSSVVLAGQISGQSISANSSLRQDDTVQTSASHHYQSPADRAKDALLIAEVKSGLMEDGVADDYPVAVDCDHGTILLTGVIGSAEDARHAGDIAADAGGVVGVKNQLTWRK